MSTPNDPPRILAEPQSFLHDALSAAKGELPSASKLGMLQEKLALATAAGAGTGTAVATTAVKSALWLKIALSVVAASALGVTAVVVATPKHDERAPLAVHIAPSAMATTPPSMATEEASSETPSAFPTASATLVAPSAAATSKPQGSDLAEETRLLTEAQHALAGNPAAALRVCENHRKKFPSGLLSQERDAVVIEALVKLGRPTEAKRAASAFAHNYPGSSHLRRISDLIAE